MSPPLLSWTAVLVLIGALYLGILVQAVVAVARDAQERRRRQRAYGKRLRYSQRGRGR